METKNRKKTLTTVVGLAALLVTTGTFAWSAISQQALNEKDGQTEAGARVHDDYNKETGNKDIYAENYRTQNVIVRIKLSEYMENNGTPMVAGTLESDKSTWTPYTLPGTTDSDAYRQYVTWDLGGEKVFLPTFNEDPGDKSVDASGDAIDVLTAAGPEAGKTAPGTGEHVDFNEGTEYDKDGNVVLPGGTGHVAKSTLTQKKAPLSMAAWLALSSDEKKGDFWVIDEDGWAYWANLLAPGESTSLLLSQLNWNPNAVGDLDDWYYGIDVVGEFVTKSDVGKFAEDSDVPTANADKILEMLASNSYSGVWEKTVADHTVNSELVSMTSLKLSELESTGLYIKKGEEVTVSGENISIIVGPPGYFDLRPDSTTGEEIMVSGTTTITATDMDSPIYIRNISGVPQTVSITGGNEMPTYKKGSGSASEFRTKLKTNSEAPFIEFVGEHTILTLPNTYKDQIENVYQTNGLDIISTYLDQTTSYALSAVGLSFNSYAGNNQIKGTFHYVQDQSIYYAYATSGYMGLSNDANIDALFTMLASSKGAQGGQQWGLWHETSHLLQHPYLKWTDMTEVTVNIGSYYIAKQYGYTIEDVYRVSSTMKTGIVNYLDTTSATKKYDDTADYFVKLGLFIQLMEAYGDDVFAKLHQEYREISLNGVAPKTDDDKQQLFMVTMSQLVSRDLSDFFTKWGLYPNVSTLATLSKFSKPSVPIERNLFYDGKTYFDGDGSSFELLGVDVKEISIAKDSPLDSSTLSISDLINTETLMNLTTGTKEKVKSYEVTQKKYNFLSLKIVTENQLTGYFEVPVLYEEVNRNRWGNVYWELNESTGNLTLKGEGFLDLSDQSPWNRTDHYQLDASKIKTITISQNVLAPENSQDLFSHLPNLESFSGLEKLDTSNVINMRDMFAYDPKLTELNLSTFTTERTTSMQGLFYGSNDLVTLNLSNFDTSGVTNMSYLFYTLGNLTSITLGEKSVFPGQSISYYGTYNWVKETDPSVIIGDRETFLDNYDGSQPGRYSRK